MNNVKYRQDLSAFQYFFVITAYNQAMYFYEFWVADKSYHGKEPLTYSSVKSLKTGQIVNVPLGKSNKPVIAMVRRLVAKPDNFEAKQILNFEAKLIIPKNCIELAEWILAYYPSGSGQIFSQLISSKQTLFEISGDSPTKKKRTALETLNKEQLAAINEINQSDARAFLLHGNTGSGKTRVYLELANETLESGKSVLILTPEIGLSPQTFKYIDERTDYECVLYHSKLTPKTRLKAWQKILTSKSPVIVVGPRSAMFLPFSNLGLVVVDEFHDGSYKQESSPYYQTTRVASTLSRIHEAKMILGSATPPVSDYYTFEQKGLPIIKMVNSAVQSVEHKKTESQVVDLKDRTRFNKSSWLSDDLLKEIGHTLKSKKQALIYLNRRGSSRVIMCDKCGWQALCPKCDLGLIYHHDKHRLFCHSCGFSTHPVSSCPQCSNTDISYKSAGTKAIFQEISKFYPEARIARFDSDNKASERLDTRQNDLKTGQVDIIVGTQIVGKGLDLPNLSLVGMINADSSLAMPDFSAEEMTFQQINQVIGRVGRGHGNSMVIVQTYYPENPVILAAIKNNYSLFYKQQITDRKNFRYPPFSYLLKISVARKNSENAQRICSKIIDEITNFNLLVEINKPAPAFNFKKGGLSHWQLVIKSKKRTNLLYILSNCRTKFDYDLDPSNLL